MACELDPTLLVAWHLAGWVLAEQHATPQQQDIERVLDHQCAVFCAATFGAQRRWRRAMLHLGGMTLDGLVLTDHILGQAARWPDLPTAPALRQVRGVLARIAGAGSKQHARCGRTSRHVQAAWLRQLAHTLADDAYTHLQPR